MELIVTQDLHDPRNFTVHSTTETVYVAGSGKALQDQQLAEQITSQSSDSPPDDMPPRPTGGGWFQRIEQFMWERIFNVDNVVMGYRLLITLNDDSTSFKTSWSLVGVSMAAFLLTRWNPDAPLFEQMDQRERNRGLLLVVQPVTAPGGQGSPTNPYIGRGKGEGLALTSSPVRATFFRIAPSANAPGGGDPPDSSLCWHTLGNVCHHPKCKGAPCQERGEVMHGQALAGVWLRNGAFDIYGVPGEKDLNPNIREDNFQAECEKCVDFTDQKPGNVLWAVSLIEQPGLSLDTDEPLNASEEEASYNSLESFGSLESFNSLNSEDSGVFFSDSEEPQSALSLTGTGIEHSENAHDGEEWVDVETLGDSGTEQTEEEEKGKHNIAERKRRANMGVLFQNLAEAIGLPGERNAKITILKSAVEKIEELKREDRLLNP